MRTRFAPLAFVLAAACSPAIPSIDDKDGADGLDAGDGSEESEGSEGGEGDPDETDPDEPDEPDEPEESPYAGEWYAWVTVTATLESDWGSESVECASEMEITFDEDGETEGAEGTCEIWGWVEAYTWFYGGLDDDGEFSGVVGFTSEWVGESEVDVDGDATSEDAIGAEGEGLMVVGGRGGGYEVPLWAEVKLAR